MLAPMEYEKLRAEAARVARERASLRQVGGDMADKVTSRVWFGRRSFGWGLRPVRWQGWVVTGLYLLFVFMLAHALAAHHMALFVIALVVLTVVYAMVALATSDDR
jgi:hypothetical protein